MTTIRVLVMDDDNHSPMYVREDGIVYYNEKDFMVKCVAKPHNIQFKLAHFSIINDAVGELANYNEDEICGMFNTLCGNRWAKSSEPFEDLFNIFWDSADEWN